MSKWDLQQPLTTRKLHFIWIENQQKGGGDLMFSPNGRQMGGNLLQQASRRLKKLMLIGQRKNRIIKGVKSSYHSMFSFDPKQLMIC